MDPNISCYSSGCSESVVGQCPGYPDIKKCGRFYCRNHSYETKLCDGCADILMEDVLIKEYSDAAKSVKSRVNRKMMLPIIVVMGVFLLGAFIFQSYIPESDSFILFSCPALIIMLTLGIISNRRAERSVLNEIESEKPEFKSFYKIWKKERNKDQIKAALGIGSAIFIGSIVDSLERSHIRAEVDSELQKRGL